MPRLHQTRMRIESTQSGASLSWSCNEQELLWSWSCTVAGAASELELHWSCSCAIAAISTLLGELTLPVHTGPRATLELALRWTGLALELELEFHEM